MQYANHHAKKIANSITASMKAEGFTVTDATRDACVAILSGKQSADELVKQKVARYKVKLK